MTCTTGMRRTASFSRALIAAVVLALIAAACSDSNVDYSLSPDELVTTYDIVDGLIMIDDAYTRAQSVWPGFDPNVEPVVLALKGKDGLRGAIAINHPKSGELGTVTPIDVPGASFTSADLITEPGDSEPLADVVAFEFNVELAGVDSFVMEVDPSKDAFSLTNIEYPSTLVHEMFHRWQNANFTGGAPNQDVAGYAYTSDNFALAMLEDRALVEALTTDDDDERQKFARWFAAIRLQRRVNDQRVLLDGDQERIEGTARFIEHAMNANPDQGKYHSGNFDADLRLPLSEIELVKDYYGFGRFYATGAGVMELLQRLSVADAPAQVGGGEVPVSVLINALSLEFSEVEALVAEAKASLDPSGDIEALAAEAVARSESEPGVFGSEATPIAEAEDFVDDADGLIIEGEQLECIEDAGVADGDEISEEILRDCGVLE